VGIVITHFTWDKQIIPSEIKVSKDNRSIYLKEDDYVFRTVVANHGFMEGIHYWEIVCDGRSEHELKIGVSGTREHNNKIAFSDLEDGFAYFGIGQLRSNSNSTGPAYG